MANLSDASGTVTLTVPTKKDLKNFLFLHALSERHAEYHTIIIDRYGFDATLKDYNSLDEINQLPPTEVGGLFLSSVVKRLKADSLPKDSVLRPYTFYTVT